ncbi:MAG: glycoside hydrolase family 32 protein, partial [Candidatus Brocadiae bacterium]|nr:glycoside hydrolase family 32 protein [Candidatus Brocadiia bacterium]
LFYQHNPYGWNWANMHWGHAASSDLVHWTELPDALSPDELGMMFSGSAVVDWHNTAGFQRGSEKPIVVFYTAAGGENPASQGRPFTQCIAFSTDGGQTFAKYAGNPVIPYLEGANRDPKVIWHEPTGSWVMALYLGERDEAHYHALFASSDLRAWTKLSEVALAAGGGECPDLFELPVDGDRTNRKWVFSQASGHYLIGSFDGETFTPEVGPLRWQGDESVAYAAQTFSDIRPEDGRRIQIAWLRQELPEMPFNQMMTFPHRLTLRTTPDGIRMFAEPVREIEKIHKKKHAVEGKVLKEGAPVKVPAAGRLFDIRAEFAVGDAKAVGIVVGGTKVAYDGGKLFGAPLKPVDGKIRMQILVDRPSIEVCGNDGAVYITQGFRHEGEIGAIEAFCAGGSATLNRLEVYELESIWKRAR